MKRLIFFLLIIEFFLCGPGLSFEGEKGNNIKSRSIKTQNFSFNIPFSWQSEPSNQIRKMKREMYGAYGDVDKMIPEFFMFNTGKNCLVLIDEMKLPQKDQTLQYIDNLFKDNEVKYQWGMEQGIVRKLLKLEKTKISDIPVLTSDSILVKGELNRLTQYTFHSEEFLSSRITVQTFCSQQGYSASQDGVSHLLKTLKIEKIK